MWAALLIHLQFKWQKDRVSPSGGDAAGKAFGTRRLRGRSAPRCADRGMEPSRGRQPGRGQRGSGARAGQLIFVQTGVKRGLCLPRGRWEVGPAWQSALPFPRLHRHHQNEFKPQQINKLLSVGAPVEGFIVGARVRGAAVVPAEPLLEPGMKSGALQPPRCPWRSVPT